MKTGTIVGTIILFLSTFSILCDLFDTNISGFVSLSELIKDANGFLTVICIAYIIVTILKEEKLHEFITVFVVDIILVNRLYSNKTWLQIITKIENANKGFIVLAGIVIVLIIYIVYELILNKFNKEKAVKNNYKVSKEKDRQIDTVEQEGNFDMNSIGKEIDRNSRNNSQRGLGFFVRMVCIAVVIWGISDYVVYNVFSIKINRPAFMVDISSSLYYGAIICAVLLLAFLVANMIGNIGVGIERGSAIIALGVEICLIIFNDKFNWSKFSGGFLTAISDNWFVSIFAFIIFFMILQIAIIIIINMFDPNKGDEIGTKFRDSIKNVEEKMVILACDIIEGCISLLDFIPDFFTTIGALLLNLDQKNNEKGGGVKDDKEK